MDSVFEIAHACLEDLLVNFVSNVDKLRIALKFIRAIEFAPFNNGDLPWAVVM